MFNLILRHLTATRVMPLNYAQNNVLLVFEHDLKLTLSSLTKIKKLHWFWRITNGFKISDLSRVMPRNYQWNVGFIGVISLI